MSNLYDNLIENVSLRYSKEINTFCNQLFAFLGLVHFWYYKITYSGHFIALGSHTGWTEYLANKKIYLRWPYLRDPNLLNSEVIVIRPEDEILSNFLEFGKKRFGICNILHIVDKTSEGLEGYSFSTKSSDENQITSLLTEIPLLRLFIKKLKENHPKIFSKLQENKIDLRDLIGPLFMKAPTCLFTPARKKVLNQLGVSFETMPSPIETSVLQLLAQGFPSREIGNQLRRSKRTIEHHIERIKWKYSCYTRADLIQKANELEVYGMNQTREK